MGYIIFKWLPFWEIDTLSMHWQLLLISALGIINLYPFLLNQPTFTSHYFIENPTDQFGDPLLNAHEPSFQRASGLCLQFVVYCTAAQWLNPLVPLIHLIQLKCNYIPLLKYRHYSSALTSSRENNETSSDL